MPFAEDNVYSKAAKLSRDGDLKAAIKLLEDCVKTNADDHQAWDLLVTIQKLEKSNVEFDIEDIDRKLDFDTASLSESKIEDLRRKKLDIEEQLQAMNARIAESGNRTNKALAINITRVKRNAIIQFLLIAAIGLLLATSSLIQLKASFSSYGWLPVEGRVEKSQMVNFHDEKNRTTYHFRYSYMVDGKKFESDRYSFAYASGDRSSGVAKQKKGDAVTVYYDPDDPASAVIDITKSSLWLYVSFAAGLLFIYVGYTISGLQDIVNEKRKQDH